MLRVQKGQIILASKRQFKLNCFSLNTLRRSKRFNAFCPMSSTSLRKNNLGQNGQIILEVVLGIGVAVFFIVGAAGLAAVSLKAVDVAAKKTAALAFADSVMDEVKIARDASGGWSKLLTSCTTASPCHTETSGGNWTIVAGTANDVTNFYTQKIVIDDGKRDVSGNLNDSGTINDPSTKKVTVTVSWGSPIIGTVSIAQYFTRFANSAFTQTDWSGGVDPGCDLNANPTKYCSTGGDPVVACKDPLITGDDCVTLQ